MEEQKNRLLPSNYVTILQLKQRWLEEKERRQRGWEKPEEQNRDQRLEIQPEEIRSIENLNLHALEIDSQVRNRLQSRNSKHNRLASVKNNGAAEASGEKEDQLVVDVKLDVPPDKDSENKADGLGLVLERRRKKNKKKKQNTVLDEKNPKSEGEPTRDQNCEVGRKKYRERFPEINGENLRGRGRITGEKKGIEDEHSPNSVNVNRIWEIGSKSRNSSIHDETKFEEVRFTKQSNGIRRGYRDAGVNARFNGRNVQKERGGAQVWVRKGEVSSEISHGFHSK